jgi:hypothetical protein
MKEEEEVALERRWGRFRAGGCSSGPSGGATGGGGGGSAGSGAWRAGRGAGETQRSGPRSACLLSHGLVNERD